MTASISSSASPTSNPAGVTATVGSRAVSQSANPPQSDTVAKVDTVELSDRGLAAQAIMSGANKAAAGQNDPELDQLTQQVASGDYHPSTQDVAAALVNFERDANKGNT
jgi:anti-sigma28 factor (negative regulator of flagellin synthesis)